MVLSLESNTEGVMGGESEDRESDEVMCAR